VFRVQDPERRHQVSEEKDQRTPEPTEDVEAHMKGRMDDDSMKGMKGMKGANDEDTDDVEGHMKARMGDDEMKGMKGMKGANDEGDDVEGHMKA